MARIVLNSDLHQALRQFIDAGSGDPEVRERIEILQDALHVSAGNLVTIDDDYPVIMALDGALGSERLARLLDGEDEADEPPEENLRRPARVDRETHWKLREFRDRSNTLRRALSHASSPLQLVRHLASHRSQIEEEIARSRGADPWFSGQALSRLTSAVLLTHHLKTQAGWRDAIWLASAYDLYERSTSLRELPGEALQTPARLFQDLSRERHLIFKAHHRSRPYSFQTLTRALIAAGRIPEERAETFSRAAAYRDFYERSAVLRAIDPKHLEQPASLCSQLPGLREALELELAEASPSRSARPEYAYSSIVAALAAAGIIPEEQVESFSRWAGALELFESSRLLHRITPEELMAPARAVERLRSLRPEILAEVQRRRDAEAFPSLSLSTLMLACVAGRAGKLGQNGCSASLQKLMRLCTAAELYERSPLLQGVDTSTGSFDDLYAKLSRLAPRIAAEQRSLRPEGAGRIPKRYAVATLVAALQVGRGIPVTQDRTRDASQRTTFERSPSLQSLDPQTAADDRALARFLISQRDRIATENAAAQEKLPAESYLLEGALGHYSLSTLANALRAGGLLEERRATKLIQALFGPLEYLLRRQEAVLPYIQSIRESGRPLNTLKGVDLSRFPSLQDPAKLVCDRYVRRILLLGEWMLTDDQLRLRSLFHADELVAAALEHAPQDLLSRQRMRGLQELGAGGTERSAAARRTAVRQLSGIVREHAALLQEPSPAGAYVRTVERLSAWNGATAAPAAPFSPALPLLPLALFRCGVPLIRPLK